MVHTPAAKLSAVMVTAAPVNATGALVLEKLISPRLPSPTW
jgi:hypothetical protein